MQRKNNQGEDVGTVSEIQIQESKDAADKAAKVLDSIRNTPQIDNQVP
jgi:hypothetical protein